MIRDIWGALLMAMLFVGVAAIAYVLMLRLLRPEKDAPCVWLLELASAYRARDRLYELHLRRALLGESGRCAIVAVDRGVDEADRKELLHFCASVPQMYFCTSEALPALIETLPSKIKETK